MPILDASVYKPPTFLSNRHLLTIYPSLFRKVENVQYKRKRLELEDGDFIDLDYSSIGSEKIVVVLHGLEGSSDRPYVKGMVKLFNANGWDGLAVNFRGCSGEPNRLAQSYHSGATHDLDAVIKEITRQEKHQSIAIIGFSLGGNVTLKYLGEQAGNLNPLIKKAVAFSVPIHLESSSIALGKWYNAIYMKRFMNDLKEKIKNREYVFKDLVDLSTVYRSRTFADFDGAFTAPVHGFKNAVDYWTKSSSKQFLKDIPIPALLVNAKDDSFLSKECYPFEEAKALKNFYFHAPEKGGHVGFVGKDRDGFYWSEKQALDFIL